MASLDAPARLPRRAVLAAGVALAASGCLARPGPRPAAKPDASSAPAGQALPFAVMVSDPLGDPTRAMAALHAAAPNVDWLPYDAITRGFLPRVPTQNLARWGVGDEIAFTPPLRFASLSPALERANFDPGPLVPGALAAFTSPRGTVFGLPLEMRPLAVLYSTVAFQAVGLEQPAPDWTIDDFETACAAIQGAAKVGKLPKPFYGPLPPLAGSSNVPLDKGSELWTGALSDPGLWGAFALGFGGSVVREGRFDLTNAGTEKGMGRLVDIAKRYGAPEGAVPKTKEQLSAIREGAVFQFQPYDTEYSGRDYRFARFPRLPARPVVPVTVRGAGLVQVLGLNTWRLDYPEATVPPGALDAVVSYVLWAYGVARDDAQLPALPPPPLAAASVQQSFWSAPARVANGGDAAGDWQNAIVVEAGWPETGSTPPTGRTASIVLSALTEAVFGNADIHTVLTEATQQLNAAADQYASAAAGR